MVKILNIQNKGRILKPAKEKFKVSCPIRITPDFSKETQRAWTDHCRLLVTTDAGPEYNTQKELIITIGGETKIYHDKAKFKSYVIYKFLPPKILEKNVIVTHKVNYTHDNTGNKKSHTRNTKSKETHTHKHEQSPPLPTKQQNRNNNNFSLISLSMNAFYSPI